MKHQALLQLAAITVVLVITWKISNYSFVLRRSIVATPRTKCNLSRVCPSNHFALYVRSGAADVVGPKMCFDGKIIMSHVFNNVGPGLNIAVVDGKRGVVDNRGFLNVIDRKPGEILRFLKQIKPGKIVLVASFTDVATKLTPQMRQVFVGMGSTLINSLKERDSWVFAGRAGAANISLFEKLAVSDEKNNVYEGWPAVVEVAGCFPGTEADSRLK